MTEATTLPLSAHRDMLEAAGAQFVFPSHADVLRAFDKEETVRLATSLQIVVPKTIVVCSADQAREAGNTVKFPVVLKPRSSVEAQSDGAVRITGRPRYAKNPEELANLVSGNERELLANSGSGVCRRRGHGLFRSDASRGTKSRIRPPPDTRRASDWFRQRSARQRRARPTGSQRLSRDVEGPTLARSRHGGVPAGSPAARRYSWKSTDASGIRCRLPATREQTFRNYWRKWPNWATSNFRVRTKSEFRAAGY